MPAFGSAAVPDRCTRQLFAWAGSGVASRRCPSVTPKTRSGRGIIDLHGASGRLRARPADQVGGLRGELVTALGGGPEGRTPGGALARIGAVRRRIAAGAVHAQRGARDAGSRVGCRDRYLRVAQRQVGELPRRQQHVGRRRVVVHHDALALPVLHPPVLIREQVVDLLGAASPSGRAPPRRAHPPADWLRRRRQRTRSRPRCCRLPLTALLLLSLPLT